MIGWIGGVVDAVGKNMYVAEIQSDIMQNTSYMKDPEKSKLKLNEELKNKIQELQKENDNLARQSAEGIDEYYNKRIKELEKKKDAANNDTIRQQMDVAIKKLTEQKNAKEDPWAKLRKKIKDIENVINEINNQIKDIVYYENNTKDKWRRRPQFADIKSKIENRFSEFIDVFYNELFYYCAKLEIKNLWIVDSDHLSRVWSGLATEDTIEMYKKFYDKKATELGAERYQDWWYLDLTKKMPKYAFTNWYQRTKYGMV
jgi:predicted nuclease with TOPRIM domain